MLGLKIWEIILKKAPIIAAEDPFGINFDSAQVYAPVFGRMLYAGLRWNL
jgi:hypothetical protein